MKHEQETWREIPSYGGKYQISNHKRVRTLYRYNGKCLEQHYKILKSDGNSIILYSNSIGSKFCLDYLYELCFWVEHVESLKGEEWKMIKGYEGYYSISNMGRLRAERRFLTRKNGFKQFCKEQIVEARSKINSGYYVVNLTKEKETRHYLIHRLVAEHFLENPLHLEQVNHKDENKLNNVVENLEWCSRIYNNNYGTCQERRIETRLKNNNGKYGYKIKVNR